MTIFNSRVNAGSDAFRQNREDMLGLVDRLGELNARGAMISERRRGRMEARGQLTPRERLARLLDPGMPFLEVGNLAGYLLDTADEEKSIPGSTVITGIGFIGGVRSMVVVDDSGAAGGIVEASTPNFGLRYSEWWPSSGQSWLAPRYWAPTLNPDQSRCAPTLTSKPLCSASSVSKASSPVERCTDAPPNQPPPRPAE